jgi:ABC-type transporter Mla subunit MlaD
VVPSVLQPSTAITTTTSGEDRIINDAEGLSAVIRAVEDLGETMREGFGRMADSLYQLSASMDRMTDSVNRMTDSLERMTESLDRMSESLEHVSDCLSHMARASERIADNTERTAVAMERMVSQVERPINVINLTVSLAASTQADTQINVTPGPDGNISIPNLGISGLVLNQTGNNTFIFTGQLTGPSLVTDNQAASQLGHATQ